jgi:hypothetical protein
MIRKAMVVVLLAGFSLIGVEGRSAAQDTGQMVKSNPINPARKYCDFKCLRTSNLHGTRGRSQVEFGSAA